MKIKAKYFVVNTQEDEDGYIPFRQDDIISKGKKKKASNSSGINSTDNTIYTTKPGSQRRSS